VSSLFIFDFKGSRFFLEIFFPTLPLEDNKLAGVEGGLVTTKKNLSYFKHFHCYATKKNN
jgi:hypothetical protein